MGKRKQKVDYGPYIPLKRCLELERSILPYLPEEVLNEIFKYLASHELKRLGSTCQLFHYYCQRYLSKTSLLVMQDPKAHLPWSTLFEKVKLLINCNYCILKYKRLTIIPLEKIQNCKEVELFSDRSCCTKQSKVIQQEAIMLSKVTKLSMKNVLLAPKIIKLHFIENNIVELHLNLMRVYSFDILKKLSENFNKLQVLNISCPFEPLIFRLFPSVKKITFYFAKSFSPLDNQWSVTELPPQLEEIINLDLTYDRIYHYNENVISIIQKIPLRRGERRTLFNTSHIFLNLKFLYSFYGFNHDMKLTPNLKIWIQTTTYDDSYKWYSNWQNIKSIKSLILFVCDLPIKTKQAGHYIYGNINEIKACLDELKIDRPFYLSVPDQEALTDVLHVITIFPEPNKSITITIPKR